MWISDCKFQIRLGERPSHGSSLLLFGLCLLIFTALSTVYGAPPGGLYTVREIKPHVFVWVPEDVIDQGADPLFPRAGTAGFIVTPEGVVVVDTTNSPFHARELLYELRRRSDAPVRYVINTGSFADRMLGNEVFVDQQASIVSTAAAQAAMRRYQQELGRRLEADWRLPIRMRGIHPTPPGRTFEGELKLNLGGEEIRLLSAPAGLSLGAGVAPAPGDGSAARQLDPAASANGANAAGDLMVYLPQARVLFLGGLFENGYFPRLESRDVRAWIDLLGEVERWDVDFYVSDHGEPGGKKELAGFRRFLTWLVGEVEARVQAGKPVDEVKRELEPHLSNYRWHAPELAPAAVEAVYQQLAAPRKPTGTAGP